MIRESIAKIGDAISSLTERIESIQNGKDSFKETQNRVFPGLDEEISKKIRDIMDNFEWGKVRSVMVCLNWKWAFSKSHDGIPSIDELKKFALDLLLNAAKEKTDISSGGFRAVYEDAEVYEDADDENKEQFIQLEFIVADYEGFSD